MKKKRCRIVDGFVVRFVISLAVLGCGAGVYAQKSAPQRDVSDAERNVRSMEIGAEPRRDSKTILTEVNEDFERLRVMNEEIKKAISEPLNYRFLSDSSVEMKKRTMRLRTNLTGLPKIENDQKRQKENVPLDEAQMKALLASLNGVISSFLTNPVFSDMGTLDNQLALKARHDLEHVIEMSDVIKKGADKLGKSADNRVNPKANSPNE